MISELINPFELTYVGKAVIRIGKNYCETEEMYEGFLPEIVSSDLVDGWNKVLQINPFAHMSKKKVWDGRISRQEMNHWTTDVFITMNPGISNAILSSMLSSLLN